jgi:hypothetical protein
MKSGAALALDNLECQARRYCIRRVQKSKRKFYSRPISHTRHGFPIFFKLKTMAALISNQKIDDNQAVCEMG